MRGAIARGQYPPGTKLPTEAALAQRFGVNRHTVRHAISALVTEGLVHTRRGAGVFVLTRPLEYPLSDRVRFHQNLMAAGRTPQRRILSIDTRAADAAEAHALEISMGAPVVVAHAVSFADGTPIALGESRYPAGRLAGIADALGAGHGVTHALGVVGVRDYRRTATRLTARSADATQAAHLRVPSGAPLLLSEAISCDIDGQPVEFGQTWFAGERIALTLDHEQPDLPGN